ncbi:MAG: tetratricopeptide repeat protein, partial [Thermoplasmata archaeon]
MNGNQEEQCLSDTTGRIPTANTEGYKFLGGITGLGELTGFLDSILDKEKRTLNKASKSVRKGKGYLERGMHDYALGQFEKASTTLEERKDVISKYVGDFSQVYDDLAYSYFSLGKPDMASNCVDAALQLDPNNVDALNHKGYFFHEWGRNDEALHVFDNAIELSPDRKDLWANKGDVYVGLGNQDGATSCFRKVIEIDPLDILNYDKLLNMLPGDVDLLLGKGNAFLGLKKPKEAIPVFDEILKADSRNKEAWRLKATALSDVEQYDEALQALDNALDISPHDLLLWMESGRILRTVGRKEDAVK